jgi:aminopeptidase N
LETTGISMFNADFRLDSEGRYSSFELVQTAPNDVATSNTIRPHRLAIGLYREQDGRLVRTERIELDTDGERTSVAELVGVAQPDVLLINDEDLTYCRVRLDEKSLQTLRSGGISQFAESLPRALTWLTAWDMTRDGELAARDYLAMVIAGAAQETDIGVMQSLSRQALRALEIYADPQWAPTGYAQLATASREALLHAEPGSDHQLAWAYTLLGSARSDEHLAFIRGLLEGTETVEGLALDADLRWALLQALVARGEYGQDEIEDEAERDRSSAGAEHAATARALLPTAEAKEAAWQRAIFGDELPNAILRHTISGFAPALHAELVRPYAERYFDEIAGVWQRRSSELAQDAVVGLFPTWSSTISTATVDAADEFLTQDDVPTALKRLISEGRSDVARALRNRQVDAAAG